MSLSTWVSVCVCVCVSSIIISALPTDIDRKRQSTESLVAGCVNNMLSTLLVVPVRAVLSVHSMFNLRCL